MTIIFKHQVPPFSAERLEAISRVLADTKTGVTGLQIDNLLRNSNIRNPTPDMTKWKRLYGTIHNPLAHNPKVEWDMTE